jgi:hypothetical protein
VLHHVVADGLRGLALVTSARLDTSGEVDGGPSPPKPAPHGLGPGPRQPAQKVGCGTPLPPLAAHPVRAYVARPLPRSVFVDGRPSTLVWAGAEEGPPGQRLRHEMDEQGTGWPGPRDGWHAEVAVSRCCRGIQSADRAVHQHAPGDPEVTGVIVHFEGDASIQLRQLGQGAAWRNLEEEDDRRRGDS